MKICICIGSSCYLKGTEKVIERLQQLIKENKLINDVELSGSFCLGRCAEGVSMLIDEEPIQNVNINNIDEIFLEKVLKKIRG